MVKIVIDGKRELVAVNLEMHSDLGIELYDDGSNEDDLYGANIYYNDKNSIMSYWNSFFSARLSV